METNQPQEDRPFNQFSKMGIFLFAGIVVLTTTIILLNIFLFQDVWQELNPFDGAIMEGSQFNQYPSKSIEEVLEELHGRIPILEYHIIESPYVDKKYIETKRLKKNRRTARYFVSSDLFRTQLETLYSNNFRNISLDEYLSLMKGKKKSLNRLPPESKLYVLTFDDAALGQFEIMGTNTNGEAIIDPDCAVGIMLEFAKKHPDFMLNAAFNVPFDKPPFFQAAYVGKKLNLLLDYGFEIVNHTKTHKSLSKFLPHHPEVVSYEIGHAMELFESYLGYRANTINKICYPSGKKSPAVWDFIRKVEYNGKEYRFVAGLDASGLQAKNPNDLRFNPYNIARIEISGISFDRFVVKAPGLFRTPALQDKTESPDYSLYHNADPYTNTLDLIKIR